MNRIALFTLVVLCCLASTSFALGPVGPPTAGLKTGQWKVGFDYSKSEIDFDIDWDSGFADSKAEDIESNAYLARIGVGLNNDWELYGLFGAQDHEGEIDGISGDGGTYFAGGFGTKITFEKSENISWGFVYQMLWTRAKESGTYGSSAANADARAYDIFTAVGPTLDMGGWRIYGAGGLYHYKTNIDAKSGGTSIEGDVSETMFAAYAGTEIDLSENSSIYVEYLIADDAWGVGTGIGWRF